MLSGILSLRDNKKEAKLYSSVHLFHFEGDLKS